MASLAAIRTGLKSTITTAIPALFGYSNVPEVTNLPAVVVAPRNIDFQGAMGRGLDVYEFDLIVLVSRRDDDLAQTELDAYVTGAGASSIRQAIWNARTLGLANTDAHVYRMESYGAQWDVGDLNHVGAVLKVRVSTTGTA